MKASSNLACTTPNKKLSKSCQEEESKLPVGLKKLNETVVTPHTVQAFLWVEAQLCAKFKEVYFGAKVWYVYNPLQYASAPHAHYVSKYCQGPKDVLFLGMNPGPFGMAQNGVPFGDTTFVCDWMSITGDITQPTNQHPKRPIQGFECTRSEVSGTRFWTLISKVCGTLEQFFKRCFVHNYCPIMLLGETGKNIIPSSLGVNVRHQLEIICDDALMKSIRILQPKQIVAIGKYAEDRSLSVLHNCPDLSHIQVHRILHPSPASPQANKGWEAVALKQLEQCEVLSIMKQ